MKKPKLLGIFLSLITLSALYGFTTSDNDYAWFYLLKHKTGNEASIWHESKFEYMVLPGNLSLETRSKIKDAKEARIEVNDDVSMRSVKKKIEHNERVIIYRLDFKNSTGHYSRYFIATVKEDDTHYTSPAKHFVDEELETSMIASYYKKHKIVYDQKPYVISGKPGTSYWDKMKKEILEWMDDEDEKEEIKKATGVGVRG